MKKIILIFALFFTLASCQNRDYRVILVNGEGWTYSENFIYCDSFDMISTTEADIWVDGKKTRVKATRLIKVASE